MIKLYLGNVGSGKTISAVRDIVNNLDRRKIYTNIIPRKKFPHVVEITGDMIVKKNQIKEKRDGTPVYDFVLNEEYWKGINEPINVILDEAHSIMNPRRSMSKVNIIVTDWLAMIRRVLGGSSTDEGELILITQLWKRLDVIAREMATNIRYHICHFRKTCRKCKASWVESSETSEPYKVCPMCSHHLLQRHGHILEIYHFSDIEKFIAWKEWGMGKGYHAHYFINDIEKYFPMYNTLQWENMFSKLYE